MLRILPSQTNVPVRDRQAVLKLIFDVFTKIYAPISHIDGQLAGKHALAQEEEGYQKSGGKGYKNVMSNILVALKKRPLAPSTLNVKTIAHHPSLGTQSTYLAAQASLLAAASSPLTPEAIQPFVLSLDDLNKWGYLTSIPSTIGNSHPTSEGEESFCSRCDQSFTVPVGGLDGIEILQKCWFHHGRRRWGKDEDGSRAQIATCCGASWTSQGCTTARSHVFKEEDEGKLHERVGYVKTEDLKSNRSLVGGRGQSKVDNKLKVVGCDCEMVVSLI